MAINHILIHLRETKGIISNIQSLIRNDPNRGNNLATKRWSLLLHPRLIIRLLGGQRRSVLVVTIPNKRRRVSAIRGNRGGLTVSRRRDRRRGHEAGETQKRGLAIFPADIGVFIQHRLLADLYWYIAPIPFNIEIVSDRRSPLSRKSSEHDRQWRRHRGSLAAQVHRRDAAPSRIRVDDEYDHSLPSNLDYC